MSNLKTFKSNENKIEQELTQFSCSKHKANPLEIHVTGFSFIINIYAFVVVVERFGGLKSKSRQVPYLVRVSSCEISCAGL